MNVSQADLWRICPHPTMTREGDVLRCDWCGIPYPTSKKRKNKPGISNSRGEGR